MGTSRNDSAPAVLVLGGAGFIGRHAVASLQAAGARVIVGSRQPASVSARITAVPEPFESCQIRVEEHLASEQWEPLIKDADVVLNCVGILRQRGAETYDKVHHRAPAALAQACKDQGKRYVHVSALGTFAGSRSRFSASKIAGEMAIEKVGGDWIVTRPSLLDGPGGFGARWLRGVSKLPVFFTLAGANGKIAALDVKDLGEALTRLCLSDQAFIECLGLRRLELGGEKEFTFPEYIAALRQTYTSKPHTCITVPDALARIFAHLFDLVHFTPFSFGHWELLLRDNKPEVNMLREVLGRSPAQVPVPADRLKQEAVEAG